jgi:hypothetical protein
MNDINFHASFSPSDYLAGLSDYALFALGNQAIMVNLKTQEQVPGDYLDVLIKEQIRQERLAINRAILGS